MDCLIQYLSQEERMANIASLLKEEITRLARKEVKRQTETLKKTSAQHRKYIAALKQQISDLQRQVSALEKQTLKQSDSVSTVTSKKSTRFSAKGLRSHRNRLGLSAADYGKLIGVTGQTVYKWENEAVRPRVQQVEALTSVRSMGKKEVLALLEKQAPKEKKKRKKK
jgi:DNA-binding transcriptional regulator YiaG